MIFFCWRIGHCLQSANSIKVSSSDENVMVSNIRQSVRSVRQSVKNSGVSVSVSNSVNKTVSFMTKQINKFSKLATQLVSQL